MGRDPLVDRFGKPLFRRIGVEDLASDAYHSYKPSAVLRTLYSWYNKRKSTPIMEMDWKNLIILDGCRYDAFEGNHVFEGDLRRYHTGSTQSRQFMRRNFSTSEDAHDDVVMVTAAKHDPLEPDAFFEFIHNDTEWDSELRTIRPEPVIERGKEMAKRHPDKRTILWLMQPHSPFINENGQIIESRGWSTSPDTLEGEDASSKPSVFDMIKSGELKREEAWAAYIECLQYIQRLLESYIEILDGKTVITADHGTAFGDSPFPFSSKAYGGGTPGPELMEVPWFTLPNA